jgi:hypothetical protein
VHDAVETFAHTHEVRAARISCVIPARSRS